MKYLKITSVLLLTLLALGCPPGGPGNGEGMGEGSGEGSGEGMGEMPVPDAADHFFVDGNRGNDDNDGRRANPLESIGEAIRRASDLGGSVFVAGGGYVEFIVMQSAVHVFGGFNPDTWIVDRENFPATVMSSGFLAFAATNVTDATLEGLNLMSTNPIPVENAYGIVLLNSADITLRDLTIISGDGAPGEDGRRGERGGSGSPGGAGLTAAPCGGFLNGGSGSGGRFGPEDVQYVGGDGGTGNLGDGSPGEDGHPGDEDLLIPVAPGGAGGDGGPVGQDGSDGEPGTVGAPGRPGAGGTGLVQFTSGGQYLRRPGGRGGQGGFGGAGGGGGGGGGAIIFACGGSGGGGGGPAFGGQGSAGGEGGHASFGIFVFESVNINITNCTVATGNGGNAGAGGTASPGAEGGAGGTGGARVAAQGSGGNGGAGGDGGPGGPGGGGVGGPVFGIAYDVSSEVTIDNITILLGEPGLGGMSEAGPDYFGADGQALETFEFTPQTEKMP